MTISDALWAAAFASLFGVFWELWRKRHELAATLVFERTVRRTGLKAIYPRSHKQARVQLHNLLNGAKDGDEVFIVGRTHRGLLSDNNEEIIDALARGAVLKFLFLDLKALTNLGPGQRVDLRSLRLPNAYAQLVDDLGDAEAKLRGIRDACAARKLPGSLLVYRTDVLVQSSIVMHVPLEEKEAIRLLYDFSFGGDVSEKFVQCYKSKRRESPGDFCSRLRNFYAGLFDLDVSSFAYELSYRHSRSGGPPSEIEAIAVERMNQLINAHAEAEEIRNNPLKRIVPAAARVFSALGHDAPPPISAQLELTNECTTHCRHCFRHGPSVAPQMGTGLARKILAELSDYGVRTITLSGGEPTKHGDFAALLRYAAEDKNLAAGVLSNGVGVSDDNLRAIHRWAKWLRLSIDGGSPAVYNRVRKPVPPEEDAFRAVENVIRHFAHLNDKGLGCKISICYTIQQANVDDVSGMVGWVRRQPIPDGDKCLTFKFAHGKNGFLCTEGQLRKLYDDVFINANLKDAANIPYLRWFLERQSSTPDVAEGHPTQSLYVQQPTRCFAPHLFTLIDPQGDVYPCCYLFDDNGGYSAATVKKRSEYCMGSLTKGCFKDLWNGARYQQLREELAKIDPRASGFAACGECTRHCNHNRGLSQLYSEYSGLQAAGGNSDAVMTTVVGTQSEGDVWL